MKKLVKTVYREVKFWYRWDDKFVGQRVALGKYEPYVTKLILGKVEKTLVDVGANIGYYSLLAAKKGAKVWAFEPEQITFSILKKNVKSNGFNNVKIFKKAVGNKGGRIRVLGSGTNYGNNVVGKKGKVVKMIKLDEVIKEKVDLIKIDVEGREGEAVAGAKNLIERYKPVIFFEYGKKRNREMIKFLRRVYGRIWAIDEYVQICYSISDENLGNFEGNLVVGLKGWEWKDMKIKKLVKRMLRIRPLT